MFKVLPISPYEGYLGRVCFCAFSHSRGIVCSTTGTFPRPYHLMIVRILCQFVIASNMSPANLTPGSILLCHTNDSDGCIIHWRCRMMMMVIIIEWSAFRYYMCKLNLNLRCVAKVVAEVPQWSVLVAERWTEDLLVHTDDMVPQR